MKGFFFVIFFLLSLEDFHSNQKLKYQNEFMYSHKKSVNDLFLLYLKFLKNFIFCLHMKNNFVKNCVFLRLKCVLFFLIGNLKINLFIL